MRLPMSIMGMLFLAACQGGTGPGPSPQPGSSTPSPTPSPTPSVSVSPVPVSGRTAAALNGCWVQSGNPGRTQTYTATGPDTLDLVLNVNGSQRFSKVRLKPDGFLEIIGEPTLGETLEWVGDTLIFRINGSQVATFVRC